MKGLLFAFLAGAFITVQGVANTRISADIGTWPAAALTQFVGFVAAFVIWIMIRDGNRSQLAQVSPLYLSGGALAAIIIFANVTAIQKVGVTLSMAVVLIAQLLMTFLIDSFGWFGVKQKRMRLPQFIGIGLMIAGVVILKL
ncbi:DMT family transporter [Paenibacillus cisolokensis]|uniref:EamA-like transporter family protein n=1 Tax=Paenibacillus campinasensis TaxID=66347 RepID=A0ABW9T1E8_9BACL|nr:DMT family transporter [Paenibacillus campinasensis]MUG66887.1 EamA-like transporter family protein [Paenibacillus campinasensis]